MMIKIPFRFELILLLSLLLSACGGDPTDAVSKDAAEEVAANEPEDVIARVGDQVITFSDINTMINSAAIVGLSMPELGSPERDVVRITLLDKIISANLLYLDARKQGLDQEPQYREEIERFSDAILAKLYRSKHLVGDIEVTSEEVESYFQNNIKENTEFTEEVRAGIEATIRKERLKERMATIRERLREGHSTAINVTELDPGDDQVRSADDVVAELDDEKITWNEVKTALQRPLTLASVQARIDALDKILDTRIMTRKAREVGLRQDPIYQKRLNEFSKTRLINMHRNRLLVEWEPTDEEIRAYYDEHKDRMIVREVRKVQMLVTATEEEAAALKQQIEAGEITFHKAVAEHSIVDNAKKTLGQIGWVSEGTGFPELDEVTFMLEPGEIGGPVLSPAGWHLVRILDQRDAMHKNIADPQTRQVVRKNFLDDRLAQYVVNLRTEEFETEVDDSKFSQLSQKEVDWYQEMMQKAQVAPEEVLEEIERLQGQ